MVIGTGRTLRLLTLAVLGACSLAAGCAPNARENFLASQRVSIRAHAPATASPSSEDVAAQVRPPHEP